MVGEGNAPKAKLVSERNGLLNQLPRTIPVSETGENEPQQQTFS
jgi:hypothetical protein